MGIAELHCDEADESPAIRQQAGRQGWTVDTDGWFRRIRIPSDPAIGAHGFMTETEVYVGSCELALQYDALTR